MSDSRKNKLSNELIKEIREYYDKGNSCQKTADQFGVGKTTVRSYVNVREKIILTDKDRKIKNVEAVQRRRKKIKQMAIDYKGGSCQTCGYNKYNGALEFHHTNPNEKDFSIGEKGHCTSWEKVKEELDKCVLVCSNCHREIHAGLIKI